MQPDVPFGRSSADIVSYCLRDVVQHQSASALNGSLQLADNKERLLCQIIKRVVLGLSNVPP